MTEVSMHYGLWKSLSDTKKGVLCERSVCPVLGFFEQGNILKRKLKFWVFYGSQMQIFSITPQVQCQVESLQNFPLEKHPCLGQVQIVEELRNSSKAFSWEDERVSSGCLEIEDILVSFKVVKTADNRNQSLFPAFFSPTVSVTCCNTASGNSLPLCVLRRIWK